MLTVFLHGFPDATFMLIVYGVVAAIALLGALTANAVLGRGSAARTLVSLLAGTIGGFALAFGLYMASFTSLAWMFKGVSAGPLLTAFVELALGGGYAVAALVRRTGHPRKT